MRQRILGALILATVMITTTFAKNIDDKNVNEKVLTTFSQKFNQAKNVRWVITESYVKASFTWNEQIMNSYFTEDGGLIGVSRNLVMYDLPINLQTELKQNLAENWITELYEFATEGETRYFASIENADYKITLKSVGSSAWTVYKKTKKS